MIKIPFKYLAILYLWHIFAPNIDPLVAQIILGIVQLVFAMLWYRHTETPPASPPPRIDEPHLLLFDMARDNDNLEEQVRHLQNQLDDLRDTLRTWEHHMVQLE